MDSAWYLISEVYCQIHQKINCANFSKRLDLSQEEGEKWIVSLIREMKMGAGAKVDLEEVRFFYSRFSFLVLTLPIISTSSR